MKEAVTHSDVESLVQTIANCFFNRFFVFFIQAYRDSIFFSSTFPMLGVLFRQSGFLSLATQYKLWHYQGLHKRSFFIALEPTEHLAILKRSSRVSNITCAEPTTSCAFFIGLQAPSPPGLVVNDRSG